MAVVGEQLEHEHLADHKDIKAVPWELVLVEEGLESEVEVESGDAVESHTAAELGSLERNFGPELGMAAADT